MTVITSAPLAPRRAAALLGTMPIILRAEFEAAPGELLRWRPAPEEWCVLEVVGHLIETEERGFAGRIRTILAEERPRFTAWDPSAVARERQDEESDPVELLAEFTGRRTAGVALVERLTAADLARGGDHPEVGFLTVNDLLHEWIHHDANHLRQMLATVQAYTWPQMGNAQRFSAPDSSPNGPE
ncbi:MAG TPA: DinB family protein [Thermomicrobiales bacterium]|nr:DinB family protein [Thermomicrobiales bacterium]